MMAWVCRIKSEGLYNSQCGNSSSHRYASCVLWREWITTLTNVCFHHHDNRSHSSMWLYYQWVCPNEPKWKGRTLWGASLARWGRCDHSTQTQGAAFSFCGTPPVSWPGCHDAVAVSGATQEAILTLQHSISYMYVDAMQAVMIALTFPLIDVEMQNVFANTKMFYSCNTVRVEGEVVCGCNTERWQRDDWGVQDPKSVPTSHMALV